MAKLHVNFKNCYVAYLYLFLSPVTRTGFQKQLTILDYFAFRDIN